MRRDFNLRDEDQEFLSTAEKNWEAVKDGSKCWIIIKAWKLPDGYNVQHADIALLIPPGYPDAQLDMFYVLPHLSRADGKAVNALVPFAVDGQDWQRWSRHRNPANPWQPGKDNLCTHMALADYWFRKNVT